jgi:hypothetical protein
MLRNRSFSQHLKTDGSSGVRIAFTLNRRCVRPTIGTVESAGRRKEALLECQAEVSGTTACDTGCEAVWLGLAFSVGSHPLVTKNPLPQALVVNLGPRPLSFELRAWTERAEDGYRFAATSRVAIESALAKENIGRWCVSLF